MNSRESLQARTISDFGDQWSKYTDNEGWYGSIDLFDDIIRPLLSTKDLKNTYVAEIGSGTGRIVSMLLNAGVNHIYAIEPSPGAFAALKKNIEKTGGAKKITALNAAGDRWVAEQKLDYVFSIGVLHHVPDPKPAVETAYTALRRGGHFFIWLYGYEGNELYLKIIEPFRKVTARLPHFLLRFLVELMYVALIVYENLSKYFRLPFQSYLKNVFWPLDPDKRRLVIYDQLNPAYARYYKKKEAVTLLEDSGFKNVRAHHRHGYSWSVIGQKPL